MLKQIWSDFLHLQHKLHVMLRNIFLTLLFIFSGLSLHAQDTYIDSLYRKVDIVQESDKTFFLNEIAAYLSDRDPEKAIGVAEKALKISQKHKLNDESAKAIYNKAKAMYSLKKYSDASNLAVDAIRLFTASNLQSDIASSYMLLGKISREKNEFDRSALYFDNALTRFEQLKDSMGMTNVYTTLASLYHREYQFEKSIQSYQQAIAILEKLKKKEELSTVLSNMAIVYRDKGDNPKALEVLNKAVEVLDSKNKGKHHADVLNLIGSLYLRIHEYDKALEYYIKVRNIRKRLKMDDELAAIYINIGLVYREKNMHKEALQYYLQALEIRQKLGEPKALMTAYNYVGGYYLNIKMFNESLVYYLDMLKLSIDYKDKEEMANALSNIAVIYINQKNYRKAIDYLEYALKLNLEKNDYNKLASNYILLGNTYLNMEDYMTSLQCFEEALEYRKKIGDEAMLASTYINLGQAYQRWKKYKKAWENFSRSVDIRQKIKDVNGISISYNHLGNLFIEQKDTVSALTYFEQSIQYAEQSNNKYQLALCSRKVGEIYLGRNQNDRAFTYLQRSLKIGIEIMHLELQRRAYYSLHQYYYNKKELQKALDNFRMYANIGDSINQKINDQSLLEKQIDAEINIKDKKINDFESEIQNLRAEDQLKAEQLLWAERLRYFLYIIIGVFLLIGFLSFRAYRLKRKLNNSLRDHLVEMEQTNILLRESEKELKRLNGTKDKFFSIIAHDLRNSLNGILQLTQLLIDDVEQQASSKKEIYHLLNDSATQLNALLNNLLEWSRSQTGRITYNPQFIELSELAAQNIKLLHLNAGTKKIKLEKNISSDTKVFADQDMLNTVIRNLMSNAIKFTPEGGIITISAQTRDEDAIVTIEDNGVGISEENLKKMFQIDQHITTMGTNMEAGTGLGLILCKELVEKNKGKIWVESQLGRGSKFIFTVPRMA